MRHLKAVLSLLILFFVACTGPGPSGDTFSGDPGDPGEAQPINQPYSGNPTTVPDGTTDGEMTNGGITIQGTTIYGVFYNYDTYVYIAAHNEPLDESARFHKRRDCPYLGPTHAVQEEIEGVTLLNAEKRSYTYCLFCWK